MSTPSPAPPVDKEALRRRYRAERDKRLRPDGSAQYRRLAGELVRDPYLPVQPRDPRTDHVTFTFIGGGFAGLVTGARVKEAGVDSVRVLDKAGDFGGTWYWNRYPGAQCDTASYVYLPLLEETGYMPTEKYTHAPEILEHCRRIGRHYGLYDDALFHTEVRQLSWDDDTAVWHVRTDRGDAFTSQFVAMGTGPLHVAKLPDLPGIETFRGHSFHTSRWDYDYTGGSPDGKPLAGLTDRRVAIVGTGATAVQCIPHLARSAGELYVFQRTPSSVAHTLLDAFEDADFEKMEEIRARVDHVVDDPAIAASLKAWYGQLCKRPCFHDEYLPSFNRPNVHLVDTDGRGVERITEHGVVAGGREYEVDCIVWATGFEVGTDTVSRAGFDPEGRSGIPLSDRWADGMRTLHGIHTHGFPNLFFVQLAQGANHIANVPHNMSEAGATIANVVGEAVEHGHRTVEATAEAEGAWVERLLQGAPLGGLGSSGDGGGRRELLLPGSSECTPGYYNNEGQPATAAQRTSILGFPGGPLAFFTFIDDWRRSGRFDGLRFGAS